MKHHINTTLPPAEAYNIEATKAKISKILKIGVGDISAIIWKNRSIDARKHPVIIHSSIDVYVGETPQVNNFQYHLQDVSKSEPIHIIGAGPAGYFAALELIELGLKPVLYEQGKDVSRRKRDIATLARNKGLNTESNYAFGEGGAGTFSDGKLYTRTKKRDEVAKVLNLFNYHGAPDEILYENRPHIGTDILPRVIENIRKTILEAGGEIMFDHQVTNLSLTANRVKSIEINHKTQIPIKRLILATGHSARDIYEILYNNRVDIEAKGFAMGVRIEHPQELINTIQYHTPNYDKHLPPATYTITQQVTGRGVYSFCMCPGGIIVPATTENDCTVVNGMSNSKRNSAHANAGLVVELHPQDFMSYSPHPLSGLDFQRKLEQQAHINGGYGQIAPAQRVNDFIKGLQSTNLPKSSYIPGIATSPMHLWLPPIIGKTLQQGLKQIGKIMPQFVTNEAIIVGVESRTSSPIRIPRYKDTFNHITITNIYPCGEGAGYAGGIVSSAIDGILTARAIANKQQ